MSAAVEVFALTPMGPKGPKGDPGPQGPKGDPGAQGPPGSGGVADAPSDGTTYGRRNAAWSRTLADAPADGVVYGRLNGAWVAVVPVTGATMTGPLLLHDDATVADQAATGLQVVEPRDAGSY